MPSTVDRFRAAVTVLAGEGRMKQRLLKAFSENLSDIDTDELPIAAREPFADVCRRMREVEPLNKAEGRITATVRKMSKRDAGECAALLLGIYEELLQQPAARELRPADEGASVPAFLVKSAS